MPIEFKCESCSKLLRVPDGSGGKQCHCPGCSALLNIPLVRADKPVKSPTAFGGGTDIALCIPCPKCKHELLCDPSLVGTKGQCRNCKHIFVISDLPTNEAQSAEQSIHWVFSCPKCSQLFEGSEAMRGRRGKCHVCGEVFSIEVRVADITPAEKPDHFSSSFDDDDLTLLVLPDELTAAHESVAKTRSHTKQPIPSGTVLSIASRDDLPPIQFSCESCTRQMVVPAEAAGQLTHCPHCKSQNTIPSESELTPESPVANDPWADLIPFGSAPAPMSESNPLGDTTYSSPYSPVAPMTSGSTRRSAGKGGQYVTCGVFIAICACVGIAIEMFYIVIGTMAMFNIPNMGRDQFIVITLQIIVAVVMFVLSLLQLVGGISLARRSALYMARTGAIICCLPCVCLVLNIPFGIWGCLLAFSREAHRDFR